MNSLFSASWRDGLESANTRSTSISVFTAFMIQLLAVFPRVDFLLVLKKKGARKWKKK